MSQCVVLGGPLVPCEHMPSASASCTGPALPMAAKPQATSCLAHLHSCFFRWAHQKKGGGGAGKSKSRGYDLDDFVVGSDGEEEVSEAEEEAQEAGAKEAEDVLAGGLLSQLEKDVEKQLLAEMESKVGWAWRVDLRTQVMPHHAWECVNECV